MRQCLTKGLSVLGPDGSLDQGRLFLYCLFICVFITFPVYLFFQFRSVGLIIKLFSRINIPSYCMRSLLFMISINIWNPYFDRFWSLYSILFVIVSILYNSFLVYQNTACYSENTLSYFLSAG